MQHLIEQERFEIEVLDYLNTKGFLRNLVFYGGTMLRLCYGLNRFSVDLDFSLRNKVDTSEFFGALLDDLKLSYVVVDSANKFYTILYEIKSPTYPRSLKIEIRKEIKDVRVERAIAYSRFTNRQVMVNVVSLLDMMVLKIEAFISRKEIRDLFDIEFLLKRGISLPEDINILKKLDVLIDKLTDKDYKVKLGSLLEPEDRKYYLKENFKILKLAIAEKIYGK
ncbi:nucleotidyl transferase AbiEii/AbiGii toxin family protein [candidate division WOR-3 bacterium]|nr:nucleotidyl transferase AbiEii/AbiGii toxin family protein [candidate division WOR-3 bacterium]